MAHLSHNDTKRVGRRDDVGIDVEPREGRHASVAGVERSGFPPDGSSTRTSGNSATSAVRSVQPLHTTTRVRPRATGRRRAHRRSRPIDGFFVVGRYDDKRRGSVMRVAPTMVSGRVDSANWRSVVTGNSASGSKSATEKQSRTSATRAGTPRSRVVPENTATPPGARERSTGQTATGGLDLGYAVDDQGRDHGIGVGGLPVMQLAAPPDPPYLGTPSFTRGSPTTREKRPFVIGRADRRARPRGGVVQTRPPPRTNPLPVQPQALHAQPRAAPVAPGSGRTCQRSRAPQIVDHRAFRSRSPVRVWATTRVSTPASSSWTPQRAWHGDQFLA